MAQRFYFDLKNGHDVFKDDEGIEASDLDQATDEAHAALDEMRRSDEEPSLGDGWQLIIRGESGMTLRAIAIDDGRLHEPAISDRTAPWLAH